MSSIDLIKILIFKFLYVQIIKSRVKRQKSFGEKIILAIGIDIGGNIKFSCGNIKISIPNIIGSADATAWSGITTDKSWINNLILIENDEEYYIGELARTQSEVKQFIIEQGSLNKISDIFLLIKAILPLISKENDQDIVLGIGVPVSTSIENMRELSLKFKGDIEIKVKNDATNETIVVRKNIMKVLVMPESYGTYYNVASSFRDDTAFDAIVISLDLLTEILTIYNGQLIRMASRNLTNASLFVLSTKISLGLQQQTGTIINPKSILKNIIINKNQITISGKMYDIKKIKEHYVQQISKEIVDNLIEILGLLPLEAKIEYFIITGEAFSLFWNEIQMLILENNLIDDLDKIIVAKNPSFSNAIGFESMANIKIKSGDLLK